MHLRCGHLFAIFARALTKTERWFCMIDSGVRGIRMLQDESVTSFHGRYTQIRDELGAVGELVDPDSMVILW
jgi:hypothetical protein